jgi:hypothetical protein
MLISVFIGSVIVNNEKDLHACTHCAASMTSHPHGVRVQDPSTESRIFFHFTFHSRRTHRDQAMQTRLFKHLSQQERQLMC